MSTKLKSTLIPCFKQEFFCAYFIVLKLVGVKSQLQVHFINFFIRKYFLINFADYSHFYCDLRSKYIMVLVTRKINVAYLIDDNVCYYWYTCFSIKDCEFD